ncbi:MULTISPECIES: LysR family transcriptional regulator [Sulfitobacter]|uniref:Glycine cleavage system transcriptional activator n=1 Tax=Sulfitobacter dubius TaxID=218673 RepID=A0ABY3ZJ86_9RHOB|nr:LysR substrate-binding domain-containing protein [Sulfitobacter dubius]UOA14547.1 Glycine cleavage system transcriptional activator [Sulfitobacter dubius]WOI29990.1 LysR substrate-binding domain-containing protein [Sulfitobacter dubius]
MRPIRNIKSMQIFSLTAETRNVTRAAQLLNISQSSVSYHIKKLESDLGYRLFHRTKQGLTLTEEGVELARHVGRGLEIIQTGLDQLSIRAGAIRIALLPMFSSRWLSSELGNLIEQYPDMRLSMHNHNNNYAYMPEPGRFADIGIQWGKGDWNGFEVHPLWPERMALVCSPEYLESHPITEPKDVTDCTLLHVDDTGMWEEWFTLNEMKMVNNQPQMMLEDRHFQLSSTINGLGLSLFASWLVQEELESGALVSPFCQNFKTSYAYHLILPRLKVSSSTVLQFRDWLLKNRSQANRPLFSPSEI